MATIKRGAVNKAVGPQVTRIACYCRVSTEEQADRGTIGAQVHYLTSMFGSLPDHVIVGFYQDDGVSGTVPLEDRPEGRRLLADARAGAFDAVVVYKLDRLARSLTVLLDACETFDTINLGLRSATESIDTNSSMGKFMLRLLGILAELERDQIRERTTGGRDRLARDGRYTGGPIPLGLDVDSSGYYVINERLVEQVGLTEAGLVREMYARVAYSGSGISAERTRLTTLGVPCRKRYPTPKGASKAKAPPRPETCEWSISTVAKILHNPLYMGTDYVNSANGVVERPMPALVDAETYHRVQRQVAQNQQNSKRNAKRDYLLSGTVRCGHCMRAYSGAFKGGRRVYRCTGGAVIAAANPEHRCRGGGIGADVLEDGVWRALASWIERPDDEIAAAQRSIRERLTEAGRSSGLLVRLQRELAAKDTEREAVIRLARKGRLTEADEERQFSEIESERSALRQQIEEVRGASDLAAAREAHLAEVVGQLGVLREELEDIQRTNDVEAKRRLIRLLVAEVLIETEDLGVKAGGARRRNVVRATARLVLGRESIVYVTATPNVDKYPSLTRLVRLTLAA